MYNFRRTFTNYEPHSFNASQQILYINKVKRSNLIDQKSIDLIESALLFTGYIYIQKYVNFTARNSQVPRGHFKNPKYASSQQKTWTI